MFPTVRVFTAIRSNRQSLELAVEQAKKDIAKGLKPTINVNILRANIEEVVSFVRGMIEFHNRIDAIPDHFAQKADKLYQSVLDDVEGTQCEYCSEFTDVEETVNPETGEKVLWCDACIAQMFDAIEYDLEIEETDDSLLARSKKGYYR